MTDLTFDRQQASEAIRLAKNNGQEWLYESYPKPNGQKRKSSTGFLMHEGAAYPVKPLGRLANEIAGNPMTDNPITNVFRTYFERLGFQLIDSPEDESESASERQRRLAEVWERPGQARFRRAVFKKFGARCIVTGCETLMTLETAHVLPVSIGGGDDGSNGIPLRADLHRLFDAGAITIEPASWKLLVADAVREEYGQYHGLSLEPVIAQIDGAAELAAALRKREAKIG